MLNWSFDTQKKLDEAKAKIAQLERHNKKLSEYARDRHHDMHLTEYGRWLETFQALRYMESLSSDLDWEFLGPTRAEGRKLAWEILGSIKLALRITRAVQVKFEFPDLESKSKEEIWNNLVKIMTEGIGLPPDEILKLVEQKEKECQKETTEPNL